MSDLILVALIAATPPTLAILADIWLTLRTHEKVTKVENQVGVVDAKVEVVERATNSMKDALVLAAHQAGIRQGIEQEKAREQKDNPT